MSDATSPVIQSNFWHKICNSNSRQFVQFWQLIVFMPAVLLISDVSLAKTSKVKSATTYFYQTQPVSLTGIIKTVTFPGPPNFEDIKTGDRAEECLILFLDSPISVVPKEGDKDEIRKHRKEIWHEYKGDMKKFFEDSKKLARERGLRYASTKRKSDEDAA